MTIFPPDCQTVLTVIRETVPRPTAPLMSFRYRRLRWPASASLSPIVRSDGEDCCLMGLAPCAMQACPTGDSGFPAAGFGEVRKVARVFDSLTERDVPALMAEVWPEKESA